MAKDKTNIGIDSIEGDSLLKTVEAEATKLNTFFGADSDFNQKFGEYKRMSQKSASIEDYAKKDVQSVRQALEASLSRSADYKSSLQSMNKILHGYFAANGDKAEMMSQYEGIFETIASKFSLTKKWADAKLDERLSKQKIDASTTTMIQHGKKIVQIINDHINVMGQAYKDVYADKQSTSNYYKQAQEGKAHWSQIKADTNDEIKNLEGLMVGAQESERANYQLDMDKLKLELHEAETKSEQYETIMNKSMEEAAVLQKALDAYNSIKKDLAVIKTSIQQDVLHYANFLPNVQKVFDAARKTMGADIYGDNMRTAVNQGLSITMQTTKAIAQARAKLVSTQAINDSDWDAMSQELLDAYDIMQKGVEEAQANRETNYQRR